MRADPCLRPEFAAGRRLGRHRPYGAGVSEDCLYLNVWTPAAPGISARLPVMVWIHGGGFVVGSGAEPRYDGARLAARGIVVVTRQPSAQCAGLPRPSRTHRRNRIIARRAPTAFSTLSPRSKWVKRNIAAFGGDPDKVTIAGESAGSQAASALMASPLAKGLFARVIGESGAMFASPSRAPAPLDKAEAAGLDFMRKVGASSLAELRAAPADAILAAAPGLGFRPIVDGWFLPRSPAEIFAAGEQSDVPLMAGWNKDEGFNFTLLQGDDAKRPYAELVRAIFGERTEAALRLYPGGSPETDAASARALGGDLAIIHPTWAWIEAQKQSGRADIFRFRFDRAPLTPQGWFGERDSRDAGAFHAGELLYVFDNLHAFPWLIDDADRALAKLTSSYWINFVTNGDPNGAGLPRWPSYRSAGAPVMILDTPPKAGPEEWRERHMFLRQATDEGKGAD